MKTSPASLIRTSCLLGIVVALAAAGCSKNSETTAPSAEPTASPSTGASAPSGAASDPSAAAKQSADAMAKGVNDASARAADAAAEAKRNAAEVDEVLAAPAPGATPPPVAGTGQSDLAGAANLAAGQAEKAGDALQAQASQLLDHYKGELSTLKTNAAALKTVIDQNASMLPAGIAAKYQEFNALLPQLSSAVDSLKNYQTADLATLVPKLKEDFGKAQKLYAEIKGMLP